MRPWKTISVFVSSTFKDLQSERDFISRLLTPALNEALEPHHISVNLIDLRSGIDTSSISESERELKVLEVCISEIHNSRPYFLGIIGGRYGWVPSTALLNLATEYLTRTERKRLSGHLTGKSVTELEMLVGMLYDNNLLEHSFICIKREESFNCIPPQQKEDYIEKEREVELSDLLDRIREKFVCSGFKQHIIEYKGVWGKTTDSPPREGFIDFIDLIDPLKEQLLNAILSEEEKEETATGDSTPTKYEQGRIDDFVGHQLLNFRGRSHLVNKVILPHLLGDFGLLNKTSRRGLCLVGDSGSGKSSVFCRVLSILRNRPGSYIVLSGVGGLTAKMLAFENLVRHWEDMLSDALQFRVQRSSPYECVHTLCHIALARGLSPIVLVDSLDSFYQYSLPVNFDFIPAGVPFFFTALPAVAKRYAASGAFRIIHMPPLSYGAARKVLKAELGYKQIPGAYDLLSLRHKGSFAYESPLWLSLAATRIREFDKRDFLFIHKKETDESVSAAISSIIKSFPTTPQGMFLNLLYKSFDYFDRKLVIPSLIIISSSIYGVDLNSLEEILGDNWDMLEFAKARLYFRDYVIISAADKRMTINHAIIRQAILDLDKELTRHYQILYMQHLMERSISHINKDDIEYIDNELSSQVLFYGNADAIKDIGIKFNRDMGDSLHKACSLDPKLGRRLMYDFIDKYASRSSGSFYIESFLADIDVNDETGEGDINLGLDMAWRLIDKTIEYLKEPGEKSLPYYVRGFYNYFHFPAEVYHQRDMVDMLIVLLKRLKQTAALVRLRWGDEYYNQQGPSLFHIWHIILMDIQYIMSEKERKNPTSQSLKKNSAYGHFDIQQEADLFIDAFHESRGRRLNREDVLKYQLYSIMGMSIYVSFLYSDHYGK